MSRDRQQEAPRSPEAFRRLLEDEGQRFELELSPSTVGRLAEYLAELDVWRRKVNLTGRLTSDELAAHVLESVLGSSLIAHGARVVDIGSGAGFPGLPLAIAREDLDVTLVEPRAKRCTFLRHVVRILGLENVRVIEARIEDVGGQTFDVATTRAVGAAAIKNRDLLAPGGVLLAWTTDSAVPDGLVLDRKVRVPGSQRRIIASLRLP